MTDSPTKLTTSKFAAKNGVVSVTVRHRYCTTGSYFGITPSKLVNGRLLWPDVEATKEAK